MTDEPVLGTDLDVPLQPVGPADPDPMARDLIADLVHSEPFAVLCTQGGGQPYGSLVAFAFSPDLETFVFATPVATRKYRLLSENERVALLVDNRGRHPEEMMKVSAVTVTGRASQVEAGPGFERWAALLTARHPYLTSFVRAPSTALFRVEVARCLHVTRFQEVRQWIPASDG
jgi:nitroimidazol reductase NimA-like FMN-containing flavoprotein (pyridoxamine 5'-phosphate oxidase superfamily)